MEVDHSALTRSALAALCAAAGPNPLVAAAAVRDAAAAAVALGVQLARFDSPTIDPRRAAGPAPRGARPRAANVRRRRALRRHPAALANVRACLAAAFLRLPLARVPPLVGSGFGSAPRRTRPPPELPRPSACWITRAMPSRPDTGTPWRRLRGSATPRRRWLAGLGVGLGFLEDVVGAGSVDRDGGSFGLGGIALPPGAPAAVGAAAAGAAADLGKPRKPEDIVAAVLPPTAGTLDALIGATLVSLSLSAISPERVDWSDRGFSVKDARRLAARLATHALASLRVHRAPLAARHCDAIAAALAATDDARAGTYAIQSTGDAIARQGGQVSRRRGARASTPLGPALAEALIPRDARCEFAIKVIVHAAAPPGTGFTRRGGRVGGGFARRGRRFPAVGAGGFGSVAGAGWINDGSPSPGMRTTGSPSRKGMVSGRRRGCRTDGRRCGGGPAGEAAAGAVPTRVSPHGPAKEDGGAGRRARTVAGSIPGGGRDVSGGEAHAAFLCAHCVRNFRETPRWLVARVQRTMRGKMRKNQARARSSRGRRRAPRVPRRRRRRRSRKFR